MSTAKLEELMVAYNKVLSEARHVMALHRRMMFLMHAAANDGDKLQRAIDKAQQLEHEVCEQGKDSA
jgi:hypothetical protein